MATRGRTGYPSVPSVKNMPASAPAASENAATAHAALSSRSAEEAISSDVEAFGGPPPPAVFYAPTVPKKLKHTVFFSRPDPDRTLPNGPTPHLSMHGPSQAPTPPNEKTPFGTLLHDGHGGAAAGRLKQKRDDRESKKSGFRQKGLAAHALYAREVEEDEAEKNNSHYEVPTSSNLALFQMAMCTGYVCYTLSAWVYCTIERDAILPRCIEVWPHRRGFDPLIVACTMSALAFWTLPIFCAMFVLVLFYRDLLHTRIWYEMLGHKVLLNFTIRPFTQHTTVRVVFCWVVCAVSMVFFTQTFSLSTIQKTLPYWLPIFTWLGLTYQQWDINDQLMSVPKFIQSNPEWAKHYLMTCTFMHDHIARAAFERVQLQLAPGATPEMPGRAPSPSPLPSDSGASPASGTSGTAETDEFMKDLDSPHVFDRQPGRESILREPRKKLPIYGKDLKDLRAGAAVPHHLYHHTTGGMIHRMVETATVMQQSGESADEPDDIEMHGFLEAWSVSYWVRGFLFSAKLKDLRARRFERWFRVYAIFSYILMTIMAYLMFTSIVSCLLRQGLLEDTWYWRAMSAGFMDNIKGNLKVPEMEGLGHLKKGLEHPAQSANSTVGAWQFPRHRL